jgi:hypothetical protein
MVEHPRSGFTSDEDPGAGVPWLVTEHDAGIQPALGGPGQVDGGRSEDPDPLCVLGESAKARRARRAAAGGEAA